jgi:hypothetical protein
MGQRKKREIGYFYNLYYREQQLDLESNSRQAHVKSRKRKEKKEE